MTLTILTTDQNAAWMQVLEQCAPFDFYHLPRYHRMAEEAGEGTARLFVYHAGDCTIALPLLLRSLDHLPDAQPGWQDATSVYGYAGPIASPAPISPQIVAAFQAALADKLMELQVVSVFSRLNTFLPQGPLLAGVGDCHSFKSTVSIDLTLPVEVQRARYRKNHKEGINRLRRNGLTSVHDQEGRYFDDFLHIYHETMSRVDAGQDYYFPPTYFKQLLENLETRASLFVCLQDGRALCGGLFVECCGIVQYHLGGTLNEALKLAPMKLLIDDARLWAAGQGYRVLHLGGGVAASPDDPLLHFKRGFSDRLHDFTVWQWNLMPDAYRLLCAGKSHWNQCHGLQATDADFFPAYRCPAIAASSVTSACESAGELPESAPLHGDLP